MDNFIIKELVTQNLELELEKIGFDIAYRANAVDKYRYKTLKIFNLTLPQANILKQTALSIGADCGVHREVLTSKVEKTDVILGGSYSQIKKICDKLKKQPFSLSNLAMEISNNLAIKNNNKTKLVGVLNLTPNSFSDGGNYNNKNSAIEHFYQLIEDGADIIDIGAESTKPNAPTIDDEEQINRLNLIIEEIKKSPIPISIDTKSSEVAKYALDNGVTIINDVSGLEFDKKMAETIAKYNATVIIQHSNGFPNQIINKSQYDDVVEDVYLKLLNKINYAKSVGINSIVLDVGIGFGKTTLDNFELLNRFDEFLSLNYPLMIGISRKSLLGLSNSKDNNLKDSLSLALAYPLLNKVDYLRVHNVKLHKQLLELVNNNCLDG